MIEVALPGDFPVEEADRALCVRFRQQAQPCLHGGAFRAVAAAPHDFTHQSIVDINICAHRNLLCVSFSDLWV